MITKEQIIGDVMLQLTQGAISDDVELEEDQVAFWVSYSLNFIIATELNGKIDRGEIIPSIYIRKADCEVAEVEDTDCTDGCEDRIFVELDEEVLTLNKDGGIIEVETDQGDLVRRASVETMSSYKRMRFTKPSEENLVFSHEGKKIFIEGLKAVDIPFDKLNVWYVPKQDLLALEDTDEVLVSDLILPQVIDMAVARGKSELYGTQRDQANDANPGTTPVYHQQIANIQQPAQ